MAFLHPSTCIAPGRESPPAAVALLIVDCQNAFTSAASRARVEGADAALEAVNRLAAAFSSAGLPVAATRHAHHSVPRPGGMGSRWRSFIMEGSEEAELDARLRTDLVDRVFTKTHYSAFRGTGLSRHLSGPGVMKLVICGFQTHICVESTAREAFDEGFDVSVVSDACASISSGLHEAALLCMGHALGGVGASAGILRRLGLS